MMIELWTICNHRNFVFTFLASLNLQGTILKLVHVRNKELIFLRGLLVLNEAFIPYSERRYRSALNGRQEADWLNGGEWGQGAQFVPGPRMAARKEKNWHRHQTDAPIRQRHNVWTSERLLFKHDLLSSEVMTSWYSRYNSHCQSSSYVYSHQFNMAKYITIKAEVGCTHNFRFIEIPELRISVPKKWIYSRRYLIGKDQKNLVENLFIRRLKYMGNTWWTEILLDTLQRSLPLLHVQCGWTRLCSGSPLWES